MSNREMLKEAIADAKTIKETAIANAKAALEESFTPHIKSMLSAKLEAMDKEIDEAKDKEIDEAKAKDKMEEVDAVSYKRSSSPAHNYSDGPVNPVPKKTGTSTIQEEDLDEELDLDEMLAELDEEMAKDKDLDEAKKDMDEGKKDMDEAKDKDLDEAKKDLDEAEEEEEVDMEMDSEEEVDMDDEEIDLEDMTEDDLKGFIESVIKDMVETGELEPGDGFDSEGEEEEMEMDMDVDMEDEIEITEEDDLDEAKKDMDEVKKDMDEAKKKDIDEAKKDIDESYGDIDEADLSDAAAGGLENIVNSFKKMLAKAGPVAEKAKKELQALAQAAHSVREDDMAEIDELKKELQEVNLLNAKLLFTNKLFRAKNLSEAQKVKVLESFDKANTVKETKLVFETLNEGIKTKSNFRSKPTLNEIKGSASKATGIVNKTKQPIVESNDMVARFQKLAGIINN